MEELLKRLGIVINAAPDDKGAGASKDADDDAEEGDDEEEGGDEKDDDAAVKADGEKDAPKDGEKPDWRDRRIGKLTAKQKRAEETIRQMQTQLTELKAEREEAKGAKDGESSQGRTEEEIEAEIQRRAEALAEQKAEEKARRTTVEREFDRRSNETYKAGKERFDDFETRLNAFTKLGGLGEMERETGFLSTAFETDDPAKVLYELASDLDEAERIASLPPVKMGIEMDKIVRSKPRKQSKAPAPMEPVKGGGRQTEDVVDADDTRTWMMKRQKQVEASGRRRLIGR